MICRIKQAPPQQIKLKGMPGQSTIVLGGTFVWNQTKESVVVEINTYNIHLGHSFSLFGPSN